VKMPSSDRSPVVSIFLIDAKELNIPYPVAGSTS